MIKKTRKTMWRQLGGKKSEIQRINYIFSKKKVRETNKPKQNNRTLKHEKNMTQPPAQDILAHAGDFRAI